MISRIAAPFGSTLHDVDLSLPCVSSSIVHSRLQSLAFTPPQTAKMYRTVPRMAGYVFSVQFLVIRAPRTVPEVGGAIFAGRPNGVDWNDMSCEQSG